MVANRLSLTIKRTASGSYDFIPSSGGLVGAINGISGADRFRWYGWPGVEVDEKEQQNVTDKLSAKGSVPVFLESALADKHYNGFASMSIVIQDYSRTTIDTATDKIAWPLLHYNLHEVHLSHEDWCAYQKVNQIFAEKLANDMSDRDVAWIQDYHLMLLPAMLREELERRGKSAKIGFFLHTPFPASDFFRMLPVRKEILNGLLASDMVGFHTELYQEHFVRSCRKIL